MPSRTEILANKYIFKKPRSPLPPSIWCVKTISEIQRVMVSPWRINTGTRESHRQWQSVWQKEEERDAGRAQYPREGNMHSCLPKRPVQHYHYFSQFDHSHWNIVCATSYIGQRSHRPHKDITLNSKRGIPCEVVGTSYDKHASHFTYR